MFRALQQTKPGNEVPEIQRDSWLSASPGCIEAVLDQVELPDDSDVMRSFCWLIRDRGDIHPSNRVIDQLKELTRHSHPEPDCLVLGCDKSASEVGVGELEANAINCVRSLAAIAISSLLFEDRDLFPRFRPSLEPLLDDEHPVVRAAMVQVCLPVWNIDRSLAIQWFRKLCAHDLRLGSGHYSQQLCNYGFPDFADQLVPLIEAMCNSTDESITEHGAQEATARWLFFGLFGDLVETCRIGTKTQRKGVASIVAQFVCDEQYADRCWPILIDLCDDPSPEVRSKAGRALYGDTFLSTSSCSQFLEKYLATWAFADDPSSLIAAIRDYPGSLIPLADLICETVTESIAILRDPDRRPERGLSLLDRHLCVALLRLYEQTRGDEHADIHGRCLDMFDELLKHRITSAKPLLEDVER